MFAKCAQHTGSFYKFLNSQKNGKRTVLTRMKAAKSLTVQWNTWLPNRVLKVIWRFLQSHDKISKISSHELKHESDTDLEMVEEVSYLLTQAGTTV